MITIVQRESAIIKMRVSNKEVLLTLTLMGLQIIIILGRYLRKHNMLSHKMLIIYLTLVINNQIRLKTPFSDNKILKVMPKILISISGARKINLNLQTLTLTSVVATLKINNNPLIKVGHLILILFQTLNNNNNLRKILLIFQNLIHNHKQVQMKCQVALEDII